MPRSSLLVIGATGKTGRRIVRRLTRRGLAPRSASRRSTPAFDWQDAGSWPAVLEGVKVAYVSYHPDLAVPGAPEAITELTRRALEAGVERLVLLSGRGEPRAQQCEEIVRRSGLGFTLLRASWFNQNFDEGHLLDAVRSGTLALPAGTVREPFIDADDIADVAVEAMLDARHDGRLYELTGPRLLSFGDAAEQIARAAGRPLRYAAISHDEHHESLRAAVGPEMADLLDTLCREILDGRNESLGEGVQEALGRPPRDFADYAMVTAATGVWGGNA